MTGRSDELAIEEPLEIRVTAGGDRRTVAVTMRTPGHDEDLAAGFLFAEGLIRDRGLIVGLRAFEEASDGGTRHVVEVDLKAKRLPALDRLDRHVFMASACGVCGRASLDERLLEGCSVAGAGPQIELETLLRLPGALRRAQAIFSATGGLHAAGLFDPTGRLLTAREDVGRHNALDKVFGSRFLAGDFDGAVGAPPKTLTNSVIMVSGRTSFELVQKCAAAGVPILCSVSAPSTFAVELAKRFEMTLVGFLRDRRCNIYSGRDRIVGSTAT